LPIRVGPARAAFATIRPKGRWVAGLSCIGIIGPRTIAIGTPPGTRRRIGAAKARVTERLGIGLGRRLVEGSPITLRRLSH
jgi:hypothetical protein